MKRLILSTALLGLAGCGGGGGLSLPVAEAGSTFGLNAQSVYLWTPVPQSDPRYVAPEEQDQPWTGTLDASPTRNFAVYNGTGFHLVSVEFVGTIASDGSVAHAPTGGGYDFFQGHGGWIPTGCTWANPVWFLPWEATIIVRVTDANGLSRELPINLEAGAETLVVTP